MRRRLVLACGLILPMSPAAAQDIYNGGINMSWTNTQLLLNAEKKAWAAPECIKPGRWAVDCGASTPDAARPRERALDTDRGAPAFDAARLRFTPSPAARKRNFARFVAKTRAVDPAAATQIEADLASGDVIGTIGERVAPFGLRTDDLADAATLYVMEAWEAVAGRALPPSRARAQAVKRQMTRAIGSTPELAGASDASKQEMAEAMLIQAALIGSTAEAARNGGPERVRAVADAVATGARATLGIDLRTMTMTDDGLSEGRETGAAAPVQAGAPRAVAAGEAKNASSNYGVLAAAGGAGVGAALLLGRAMIRRN